MIWPDDECCGISPWDLQPCSRRSRCALCCAPGAGQSAVRGARRLSRSEWSDSVTRIAVVIDAGQDYGELRGVEPRGSVELVGEVPRTGEPNAELAGPEQLMADRYTGGTVSWDGRHAAESGAPRYACRVGRSVPRRGGAGA